MATFPDADSALALTEECRRCPALAEDRECIAWGNGSREADLLVVGEAPGAGNPDAERWRGGNWTGLAYTSRHSGRRIRDLLSDCGFGPDDCFFTNAVKCYPADGEGSNREPTDAELANCRFHMREEVEVVDPAAVVPTGKHATESVAVLAGETRLDTASGGFLELVTEPIECEGLGTTVVPLLHPSYQDVWVARLGYEPGEYRETVAAVLASVT